MQPNNISIRRALPVGRARARGGKLRNLRNLSNATDSVFAESGKCNRFAFAFDSVLHFNPRFINCSEFMKQ